MEILNERDACENENHPKNYRSQNSPKKHFMLVCPGDGKIREYDGEYENVVDGQGFFNEVARQKF